MKMRSRTTGKKLMALLLCAVMVITMLPPGAKVSQAATSVSNPRTANGVSTWDCIYFGNYYQSNSSTKEPIKWRVLSVEGNEAFVMADMALDCKRYNETDEDVTWETCTLRQWLNSTFLDAAFNEEEQSAIKTTTVVNEDNSSTGTSGGNTTSDKIFLLSQNEVANPDYGFNSKYDTGSETRQCKASAYAVKNGCFIVPNDGYAGNCTWWLRSPGDYSNDAMDVVYIGWGRYDGSNVNYDRIGIRPTLNINLSSSSWKYAGMVSANVRQKPLTPTTAMPTATPMVKPTVTPTIKPTAIPTVKPTAIPTVKPTTTPMIRPTATPMVKPTVTPTIKPTAIPTVKPTAIPTVKPTATPMIRPTATPTVKLTVTPTVKPTAIPTVKPTVTPTIKPTVTPTIKPTATPTVKPTPTPLAKPTPTVKPIAKPTVTPIIKPMPTSTATPTTKPDSTLQQTPNTNVQPSQMPAATLKPTADNRNPAADSTKTTLKKVTAFKAKALKKALKLTWKKAAGASGYEIQYSLNKNFKKAKKITIKKASVKTRTIKGLKKNKKYYIRIRATMRKGKRKINGPWVKTAKKTKA